MRTYTSKAHKRHLPRTQSARYDNGQVNSQYSNSNQGSGQNGAYNSNQNQNAYNDFNNTPDPFGSANGEQINIEDDDLPF